MTGWSAPGARLFTRPTIARLQNPAGEWERAIRTKRILIWTLALFALPLGAEEQAAAVTSESTRAHGPLRIHPNNPRYFTNGSTNADGSLKAVYLTGSHTWTNL